MGKGLRDFFRDFLFAQAPSPAPITESSSLESLALQFPHLYEWMRGKYGILVSAEDKKLSLKQIVEKYSLPPAQIFFMEAQISEPLSRVKRLEARDAQKLIREKPHTKILDVREDWELNFCRLPGSTPFTKAIWEELLTIHHKDTPLLVYCHFGVRSLDAAIFLTTQGFMNVHVLQGGIDAWSQEVDPSLPRYESAYC